MNGFRQLQALVRRRSHTFLRLAGVVCVLIGWSAMYFFDEWDGPAFWTLICVATVLSASGAWGGLAEQWGYKPLTNDPLGWRAAKKSYHQEPDQPEPAMDDDEWPKS